jgi:hypothetical protein
MRHGISSNDSGFRDAFERFEVPPGDFDHRAHVRLAYVYLCKLDPEQATVAMKQALLSFLGHLGVDNGKYHETITRAWVMAVSHFMESTEPSSSFDEFILQAPTLLDKKAMLSHYSAEVLFSAEARSSFVEPDLHPIPKDGH